MDRYGYVLPLTTEATAHELVGDHIVYREVSSITEYV
jgi:hypothetical protein